MFTRIYWRLEGGHVRTRWFVGKAKHLTLANAGMLTFDREQFLTLRVAFEGFADLVEEKPTEESRGVESFCAKPSPVS